MISPYFSTYRAEYFGLQAAEKCLAYSTCLFLFKGGAGFLQPEKMDEV